MAESKVARIPELIKLEYTLFVLPFVYIGMLLAGIPTLLQFILITIALVSARGAAFAANRYFGWNFDMRNPKKKESPSVKTFSKKELLLVFAAFIVIFMSCAFLLNMLAFALAPLIILLIILEPHTKKFTEHRHLTMGLVIGLGILGGYIGMSGSFPTTLPIYVLLAGYMFFSAGNDIIYTLNHVDFDKKAGLKTYPSRYGTKKALDISLYYHFLAACLFVIFGILLSSLVVLSGSVIVLIVLLLEHVNLNPESMLSIKRSFFNYSAVVSVTMLSFVLFSKIL